MSVLPESLASWIVIAVVLFWFVGAYNRLVRLRATVLQAYATLDAALSKQLDFVQASITAAPSAEASSSDQLLSSIAPLQAATTQMATLLGATRLHPLDAGGMAALATALQVWIGAWQRQHPDAVTVFDADGTLSRPAQLLPGTVAMAPSAIEPIAWPRTFGRGGDCPQPVQPGGGALQHRHHPVPGVAGGMGRASATGRALALTRSDAASFLYLARRPAFGSPVTIAPTWLNYLPTLPATPRRCCNRRCGANCN